MEVDWAGVGDSRPIHVQSTSYQRSTQRLHTSHPPHTQLVPCTCPPIHPSPIHLQPTSYPTFHPSPTHATPWCVPIHLAPIFHQLQFSLIPPPAHALSSSHPPTFHPLLLFCGNIEKYSSLRDNEIYQLITVIRKDWLLLFPSFPTFLPLNHAQITWFYKSILLIRNDKHVHVQTSCGLRRIKQAQICQTRS